MMALPTSLGKLVVGPDFSMPQVPYSSPFCWLNWVNSRSYLDIISLTQSTGTFVFLCPRRARHLMLKHKKLVKQTILLKPCLLSATNENLQTSGLCCSPWNGIKIALWLNYSHSTPEEEEKTDTRDGPSNYIE